MCWNYLFVPRFQLSYFLSPKYITFLVLGCRYGVGDSVGLAVQLEKRYRGIRSPHKFKGGVSGCVRECAEAQGKDFGVIATDKGWNSAFNFQRKFSVIFIFIL
jgi:NAD(P)H-nitrite reductase large subunit